MRFYESDSLEHIGFDFYCDIANNIVKARKEKGIIISIQDYLGNMIICVEFVCSKSF